MSNRMDVWELEDWDKLPVSLRDGGTDLLDIAFDMVRFYSPVSDRLIAHSERVGATQWIDLCSGGGGGALAVHRWMQSRGKSMDLVLTDRFPNRNGMRRVKALGNERVQYFEESVNALRVPSSLKGLRTMFGAMHHFAPDSLRDVIESCVRDEAPLAFVDVAASESLRALPKALLPIAMFANSMVLMAGSFVLMPWVRPRRLSNWLWTYGLPLIPALVAWDGTASAMRAYTAEEVLSIAQSVAGADGYEWESGTAGRAVYLFGYRKPMPRVA